jgi:patatin-related protein
MTTFADNVTAPATPAPVGSPARRSFRTDGVSLAGTQEVRLATTMTGGVSLAIWMGGVARELDLLRQAAEARREGQGGPLEPDAMEAPDAGDGPARYRRLLEILDVLVVPDIYSGTSAGGINAVMLAYGRATGGSMAGVKDVWLDLGDLGQLLRDPADPDIPSLLYGDRQMFANLAKVLPILAQRPAHEPAASSEQAADHVPTTLYVTTTLLTGESSRFSDSLGTQVQDTNHRGLFTFTDEDLRAAGAVDALALAARSTASFPGAFEPAFVPYASPTAADKYVPGRPAMGGRANITRDHWVADGGLLDNQPLDVLLQRVFETPAHRRVRRVLMFVVPSTGPVPDVCAEPEPDLLTKQYGLLEGLLKDVGAAFGQSIAADLRAITAHNDRVGARHRMRVNLARLGARTPLLSEPILRDYVRARADAEAGRLVSAVLERLTTTPTADLPPDWRDLLAIGGLAEFDLRGSVADAIAPRVPPNGVAQAGGVPTEVPDDAAGFARFGRPAYDDAMSVALEVLQRGHDVVSAARVSGLRAQAAGATAGLTQTRDTLTTLAERLHAILDASRSAVPDPVGVANQVCDEALAGRAPIASLGERLGALWLAGTLGRPEAPLVRADDWHELGQVVLDAASALPAGAAASSADGDSAVDELSAMLGYFLHGASGAPDGADAVARQLFGLVVAERALLPEGAGHYQPVELVQVSADTRCAFASPDQAAGAHKLTGLQLSHFGAFYKRSWRANDWMWGRLDGAGWIVYTLLDPRRVRTRVAELRAAEATPVATESAREWFVRTLADELGLPVPEGGEAHDPTGVFTELRFLDDDELSLPLGLPATSLWLAQAWQRPIARKELRELADVVLGEGDTAPHPDVSPGATLTWAKRVKASPTPEDFLSSCPVGAETFASDRGTPLMVRTMAKAAATAAGAVRSVRQIPGPIVPAISTVRTIALGGYRVTSAVKGWPVRIIVAGLALLVLGSAVAIGTNGASVPVGVATAAVGGYLIAFGTWQKAGWKALLGSLGSITLVAVIVLVLTTAGRRWLFGDAATGDYGMSAHALTWLRASAWHPLAVIAALVLVMAIVAAAARRSSRPTKPPPHAPTRTAAQATVGPAPRTNGTAPAAEPDVPAQPVAAPALLGDPGADGEPLGSVGSSRPAN